MEDGDARHFDAVRHCADMFHIIRQRLAWRSLVGVGMGGRTLAEAKMVSGEVDVFSFSRFGFCFPPTAPK